MLYFMFITVLCMFLSLHQCFKTEDTILEKQFGNLNGTEELHWKEDLGEDGDESYQTIVERNASTYTRLYLYTSETGQKYSQIIYQNLTSVTESAFNVNRSTKVIIHGWLVSAFKEYERELRESYLATQDVNLIAVDWSEMADQLYEKARSAVEPVGEFLAQVLDWLVSEVGVSLDTVHVVGHSLGAHIAGITGGNLQVGNLSRITGLDPAGPGFYKTNTSGRLDSSDAQFVDVIHSCDYVAGFYEPCGHVDFYPNRGTPPQPGCIDLILICSHGRSHEYFNESISSEGFVAISCGSWTDFTKGDCENNTKTSMGEFVDTSARGKFYLHTDGSYPYALGDDSSIHFDKSSKWKN